MLDGVTMLLDKKALGKTQKLLKAFPGVLAKSLALAILQIAQVVQAQAKTSLRDEGAIDLGALRASIHIVVVSPLTVLVGTPSEYAAPVEFGTVGHFVKVDNIPGLREWLVRHRIPQGETRTYFYVHPKPKPFMQPAWLMGVAMAPTTVEHAVELAFAAVGKYLA
ncbi:MAG: HK97 gp10 family phage protein [bacterium]|nr:HK97 gp10 family phage protein [bacterium]